MSKEYLKKPIKHTETIKVDRHEKVINGELVIVFFETNTTTGEVTLKNAYVQTKK